MLYCVSAGITGEPEPMTEKDLREASNAIDVFGEPLVSSVTLYTINTYFGLPPLVHIATCICFGLQP